MTRLTTPQAEVLALMQANRGDIVYCRAIGTLQPSDALEIAGQPIRRGALTAEALERKGLIKIDRRNYASPSYPVHLTVAGRTLTESRR